MSDFADFARFSLDMTIRELEESFVDLNLVKISRLSKYRNATLLIHFVQERRKIYADFM